MVGIGLIVGFALAALAHPLLLLTIWDPQVYDPVTGYAATVADLEVTETVTDPSRQIDVVRARLRHDPAAVVGDVVTVAVQPAPPSWRHPLGTDPLGRDVVSQLMFGARTAFTVGVVAATVAVVTALIIGAVAAIVRGVLDGLLMRAVELFLVVPALPLLIFVGTLFDAGPVTIGMIVGVASGLGPTAIVLRAHALTIAAHPSIEAARVCGARTWRIVATHVVPGLVPLAMLSAMFTVAAAIGAEAVLSLFGLVNVPMSWGVMINIADAGGYLTQGFTYWWLLLPVGIAVSLLSAAFYLVGRGIDEVVDPRLRRAAVAPAKPTQHARDRPTNSPQASDDGIRATVADGDILSIEHLTVTYPTFEGGFRALDGVSLSVAPGEVLGLAGASGSGKSSLAWAIMRLLPATAAVEADAIRFAGCDLLALPADQMRRFRGRDIALIPQGGLDAWNPVLTVGDQIAMAITADDAHVATSRQVARRISEALAAVELEAATARKYPHELSGGMRQRAMIAMALIRNPTLLIADEPTSALDVVTQTQVLALLGQLQRERGLATIHIAHDVAVLAATSDRIAVLDGGRIVEVVRSSQLMTGSRHAVTRAMLEAIPNIRRRQASSTS
ncbi:MAG: dipeptide/oligopeptide/nickel ABC transporter permease/ATP-binding protein, partial [Nitriliruptoraceae bacterium]